MAQQRYFPAAGIPDPANGLLQCTDSNDDDHGGNDNNSAIPLMGPNSHPTASSSRPILGLQLVTGESPEGIGIELVTLVHKARDIPEDLKC